MKKKLLAISILTILIVTVILSTVIYAWIMKSQTRKFVQFNSGEIYVNVHNQGSIVANNIAVDGLTYIDFQKDAIDDVTGTFDLIATSTIIKIAATNTSIPVKHEITITEPLAQKGLIYMLIYEGKNLDSTHVYKTDYRDYWNGIAGGVPDPDVWREKLANHNSGLLNTIKSVVTDKNESIEIQMVFWGDYDKLDAVDKPNFLDLKPKFDMTIKSVQAKGN